LLDNEIHSLVQKLDKLRSIRADLAHDQMPSDGELTGLVDRSTEISAAFELPWPWGGEWFEVRDLRPLNYITGSLGSGKARLAHRLAETLPNAAFVGPDRLDNRYSAAKTVLNTDAALSSPVTRFLAWLVDEGATGSDALTALLVALETEGPAVLVVDMVEQDLDQSSQEALFGAPSSTCEGLRTATVFHDALVGNP